MTSGVVAGPAPVTAVPPLARRPVYAIAAAVGVLLLALSGRFGYFGDELYFLATGRNHLQWGYADNPWLLPAMAKALDTIAPNSVVFLRIPAALMTVTGVVLTAQMARELGGGRRAQVLAAGAYAVCVQLLGSGHILATSTVDPFLWTLVCWLVVRWVRTRSDKLLLLAGVATAVAMQVKWLIPLLWLGIAVAALVLGPRDLVRRPALWAGGLLTVALTVPAVLWQAENGWPYLEMQQVVAEQVDRFMGGQALIVPLAVLFAGVPVGAFLVCHGFWALLRDDRLTDYRFLGWAVLVVTAAVVLTTGRYYYLAGLYPLLFAASAVRIESVRPVLWWRWVPTWPTYALSAVLSVLLTLPVLPKSWVTTEQFVASGSIGWPEVTDAAVRASASLPSSERADAVVTETYWQAAALDVYGAGRLPRVYGTERGYWHLGRPPAGADTVLYVGKDTRPPQLRRHFREVRALETVRLDARPNNINQGVRVWLCREPRQPWPSLWDELHRP